MAQATGDALPRISIVTPSYMQGQYLEETIRSILLQGYPDLEYIIMDGGSRDGSRAIIEKYSSWLAHWRSEKDDGQSHAINKGLERVTGKIVAYINSDDWYQPGAFAAVAERAASHPDEDWWVGGVDVCAGEKRDAKTSTFTSLPRFLGRAETLYQPGVFWSARILRDLPAFQPGLSFAFDHEYWVRALNLGYRPVALEAPIANFRIHRETKTATMQRRAMLELWAIARENRSRLSAAEWKEVKTLLRAYEADNLLTSVYGLLGAGRRATAAIYLLRSAPLYRQITPARLIAGAYFRTFITGSPPEWFQRP
jgi:glycosyltransferase involved in cell wall biosynthesis